MLRSVRALLLTLLLCGACKRAEPAESSAPSASAPPSAPLANAPPPAAPQVTGKWCMRSMTMQGSDRVTLDGSQWELRPDGSYLYEGEIMQSGTWTLAPGKLSMTKIGDHQIVELSADRMVLRRMGVDQHFHRDCGPELAEARRAASLRKAAGKGDYLMVKALLDQGLDVNAVDRLEMKERTALLAAAEGGHPDVVKLLVTRGADVTIVDMAGSSVFEHARKRCPEVLPQLFAKLPQPGSPDIPVFQKQLDDNKCSLEYVSVALVCVHRSALARPALMDEALVFFRDGTTPTVASNPLGPDSQPPPPVAEAPVAKKIDYAQDPSLLDPAALMNPDGDRPRRAPTTETIDEPKPAATRPKKETPGERRRREAEEEQMAAVGKALGGLIQIAEQAARDPKYKGADGEKKFEEDFKKAWCEGSKQAVADAQAGRNADVARAMGMTQQEHARKLEAKYRDECF